jgi:adenine-specific DNA-methyltransferase
MRDRLLQIKKLLSKTGSVWVHCDDYEQHRVRCVLDEVFGASAFVATILWQKRYSRDNRPAIGPVHDFIHVYAPMGTDWKKGPQPDPARLSEGIPQPEQRSEWLRSTQVLRFATSASSFHSAVAAADRTQRGGDRSRACWRRPAPD